MVVATSERGDRNVAAPMAPPVPCGVIHGEAAAKRSARLSTGEAAAERSLEWCADPTSETRGCLNKKKLQQPLYTYT